MGGLSLDALAAVERQARSVRQARRTVVANREGAGLASLSYPVRAWRTWTVDLTGGEPGLQGPESGFPWEPGTPREDAYGCLDRVGAEAYARRHLIPRAEPALWFVGEVLLWGERRALRQSDTLRELRFSCGYPLELHGGLDLRERRGTPPVAEVRERLRERYGLPEAAHSLCREIDGLDGVRPAGRTRLVDLDRIAAAVEACNPRLRLSTLHGWRHANRVASVGLDLAAETGADALVVLLFGLMHDALREHDGLDAEHGARAAALARELEGDAYTLGAARMDTLTEALARHDGGTTSSEPTVGTCWDADRLELGRVGVRVSERFLSTDAGRRYARTLGRPLYGGSAVAALLSTTAFGVENEVVDAWESLLVQLSMLTS